MVLINSKHNPLVKYLKSLLLKKNRLKKRHFLVEGKHLVTMAKDAGVLKQVFKTQDFVFVFPDQKTISSVILKHLTTTKNPQGIIGLVK